MSEVLTTSDGSELDIDCTVAYINEAEKMTSAMLREMTRVLEESQCDDKLEAVTQGHGFISFGSLVCAQVDQRTPHMHLWTSRTCSRSFSLNVFGEG